MPQPQIAPGAARSISLSMAVVLFVAVAPTGACSGSAPAEDSNATVFEGARLIVGDGSSAIEDAVFVVEGDRFTAVGPRADVDVPAGATRIDLAGKTVMPAIVNAHFHLSSDRTERTNQLQHMAYYGTGVVMSLGLDDGEVGLQMRGEVVPDGALSLSAGRGITSPEPGRSEVPHWVTTQAEARLAVQQLSADEVDFVKIWVDARNGRYERLSPELYGAVIDEAHQHGLRVTAHVFTLEDAKGLLRAGIDAFAHGIRDQDVDDELVALWKERPDVVLVPNLPGPGVVADLGWLSGTVVPEALQEMQDARQESPAAQEAFAIQARNMVRLSQEGIKIAFGTDGGSPWTAHAEMEDMVRAGLTPAQVIDAATGSSAELLHLDDHGTVTVGKSADFIVLDANPQDDISNTRRIASVFLRGEAIDRETLGARLRSGTGN